MFGKLDYLKVKMIVYHVEYSFTYTEMTLSQVMKYMTNLK